MVHSTNGGAASGARGNGAVPLHYPVDATCPECNGTPSVIDYERAGRHATRDDRSCDRCGGAGTVEEEAYRVRVELVQYVYVWATDRDTALSQADERAQALSERLAELEDVDADERAWECSDPESFQVEVERTLAERRARYAQCLERARGGVR